MCNKNDPRRIDICMRSIISTLQKEGIKTLACCCGHGRYPMTIVVKSNGYNIEMRTGIVIPRLKKFYVKDEDGYFYIPEVIEC